MEPSLDGAEFRVRRAKEHLRALRRMERKIAEVDPNTIKVHPNTTPPKKLGDGRTEYYSDVLELPPQMPANPRWSILLGEVVYNLRAALDYLVYSLAHLDSGKERQGTQFPICSAPSDFKKALNRGHLKGVNPTHRAAIKKLQPYCGGKWLLDLANISNPDKHRHLIGLIPQGQLEAAMQQHQAEEGLYVQVDFHFTRYIAFSNKTAVVPALQALSTQVADVIQQFKTEFERQPSSATEIPERIRMKVVR